MNDLNNILQNSGISTRNELASELLDRYGLNWKVEKTPLYLPDRKESGFYGIQRQDTGTVFATCKEGYETFQNSELLELVNESANLTGLSLTKGGLFKDGALVYLQLQNSPITGIGNNNDTINRYVTGINSHDGSTSLRWGLTNITISCQNSFWHAYRTMQNSLKHTRSLKDNINDIVKSIRKVQEVEQTFYNKFFKLAEIQLTENHIKGIAKSLLDADLDKKPSETEYSTYKQNRINDLLGSIQREVKEKGSTLWGLFSGVTYYTTHKATGKEEARLQSKAIGLSNKLDNQAFDLVLDYAEKGTGSIYTVPSRN